MTKLPFTLTGGPVLARARLRPAGRPSIGEGTTAPTATVRPSARPGLAVDHIPRPEEPPT